MSDLIENLLLPELEFELKRELFSRSYYEFYREAFAQLHPGDEYDENWHAEFICGVLQKEVMRIVYKLPRDKDIIINIPFRSSKSMMCTIILPVWAWTIDPRLKFISVSYSDSLALEHSQKSRDLINSNWFNSLYGDKVKLRSDINAKGFYENTDGGFRKAVGTGGSITGSGGDIILVDDPQNPKQAASEVERLTTISYYNNTLYSRLNKPDIGVRIIIMQRLHEQDLSGNLIEKRPDAHLHIRIPAELTEKAKVSPEYLKSKYTDNLFWATRFSHQELKNYKDTLGSNQYAGQLQQLPAPEEGSILKKDWFDIVEPSAIPPRDFYNHPIEFFVDPAYTAKEENDPSGFLGGFVSGGTLYIVNAEERWLEFPEMCEFLPRYAYENGYTPNSRLFIEPKASGKSIVQQLRVVSKLNVVEGKAPDRDKVTRVNGISPIAEARRIKLVKGPWNEKFLNQITTFPFATHDDMVDVLVMAVNELLVEDNFNFYFI